MSTERMIILFTHTPIAPRSDTINLFASAQAPIQPSATLAALIETLFRE